MRSILSILTTILVGYNRLSAADLLFHQSFSPPGGGSRGDTHSVQSICNRVRNHTFHPVKDGFTYDRVLDTQGVANLQDKDWRIRTLAVRDLVRLGSAVNTVPKLMHALGDKNEHVRQVSAMVLGILRAEPATGKLATRLTEDPDEVVRAQAARSLWHIGRRDSLNAVDAAASSDTSKDVRHQASLAAHALRNGYKATPQLKAAFKHLDESRFNTLQPGDEADPFELPDSTGSLWQLKETVGKGPVVLIWVFADWCPVCHREFQELFDLKEEFQKRDITMVILECHDLYPARVMTGKEFEPDYWFSDEPFYESYTKKIWWPHLADRAAGVGTRYGVQPMAYTVHAEWINRPAVVIIDDEGMIRYSYHGTFWGDRPKMTDILEMIDTDTYTYESPKRLNAT
ncbi:MAG: redoxin domain-containing protein [Bacteroidetes bacterium]|jgi:peroxiredoxin|nr:redoxin domain-containing protein [Bacteroidota bacterium]